MDTRADVPVYLSPEYWLVDCFPVISVVVVVVVVVVASSAGEFGLERLFLFRHNSLGRYFDHRLGLELFFPRSCVSRVVFHHFFIQELELHGLLLRWSRIFSLLVPFLRHLQDETEMEKTSTGHKWI